MAVNIRKASRVDVDEIFALVEYFARKGEILPRERFDIAENTQDWFVAENSGGIVACVSLLAYSERLCEVRSLIVSQQYQGNGVGSKLLQELVSMAEKRQVDEVFALTREAEFFKKNGFEPTERGRFPEKIWLDCWQCPVRDHCDEEAMVMKLGGP